MRSEADSRLDERAVRRAFERASRDYDAHAVIGVAARAEILARLELLKIEPEVILDLGTGTGHGARALRDRWHSARVIALDRSPGMLREAHHAQSWRRRFDRVCADAARLPVRDGGIDLVYSNLMLHWSSDLDAVLREVRRVLAPRGCFTFSTVGPDTLAELRAAWNEVDAAVHVHRFLDLHDIGDALLRAGFADPVMDVDRHTLSYADLRTLMRELKALGSHNALAGRAAGLTGRGRFARVAAAYERWRNADGRLPATCEVVYGQAWCPATTPPVRGQRREVVVPLDSLRRR
ncbi:MAG TPA: malonyl-ACP O-methyltransferase BioC [Steroidobacteraceae bacterium]|nr:malonyl-ACP O-methyltransferase BioC [Steroidobacteraceae bacterium]